MKDIQLFGMLRVRLYPLTDRNPLVGSVSCTFLNCPKLDFNLTNLANILDLPGVSTLIRNAVLEQIASHIVYPNVKVIPLSDIPMKTLKFNPPTGVIRLEIIEAKDLLKGKLYQLFEFVSFINRVRFLLIADYGLLGMGKSDPYCKIIVSTFNLQTQVIDNTVNPQWNFVAEVAIGDLEDQEINIEVYDKGRFLTNDLSS